MMSRGCVLLRALGRDRRSRGDKAAYFPDDSDGLVVVVVVVVSIALLLLLASVFYPPLLGVDRVLNTLFMYKMLKKIISLFFFFPEKKKKKKKNLEALTKTTGETHIQKSIYKTIEAN